MDSILAPIKGHDNVLEIGPSCGRSIPMHGQTVPDLSKLATPWHQYNWIWRTLGRTSQTTVMLMFFKLFKNLLFCLWNVRIGEAEGEVLFVNLTLPPSECLRKS